MLARGAVKDVARAMKYPYSLGDKISKMIPMPKQGFPVFIDTALEEIEELTGDFTKDGDVLSKKFHESLETTSKHRHLVLMKGEVYCLVSSYDYSNNTYIKEGEYSVGENKKFIDLSGTREGIIIFFIFKK